MHRKILLSLSLICFTAALPQTAHSASYSVESYESKNIADIAIILENPGTSSSFDPKTAMSRLQTKIGDPFSQSTFDNDLKTLSEDYDRVEPNLEVRNGEVYIELKVWMRPVIRSIQWEGNKNFSNKALRKELGIKPLNVFSRAAFNKAFNKVKEFYVKKGYFESQLSYSLHTDPKTNEVDILIHVIEGRSGKIDNILFQGFSSKEKSDILNMIYTKKYNLLFSWFSGAGYYHEEALDQDKLTIVNYLQDRGYADAKVDITVHEAKTPGKIVLEIAAEKGAVFHFRKVIFEGNELLTDSQIEPLFSARPNGIYSPEKLRNSAEAIKEAYGRKGFIDSSVHYDAKLVENEYLYDVDFHIEEGGEYKIGLIRVFGNKQTKTGVILHESLLVPGETFDSAKLKATQMRLENMGYFKNVNVYAVRVPEDRSLGDNYRDVYIEVEETTTGNLSLFFGFSSADSIFGGLDLTENNFNYKGLGRMFKQGPSAIRGGGEYAHARVSVGAKQTAYSFSWLTPYFRDTNWRIGFDLNQTTNALQSDDYKSKTYGGSLFAAYPLSVYWTYGLKYRVRHSDTHVDHDVSRKEQRQLGHEGLISALGTYVKFDSTDSAIKPHNGFRSNLEAEFAGLGGHFSFFRFGYVNSYYTELWRHGIMKYRFDIQFIEPIWKTPGPNDIPVTERFFLGGENSVRGYKAFDIGPHYPNGDPKGGISSSVVSVEYLHEILPMLDGFLFADSGAVSLKRWRPGTYRLSYGFGARIRIAGRLPIVVGMGFPVNAHRHSEVRKFFFSMGGQF